MHKRKKNLNYVKWVIILIGNKMVEKYHFYFYMCQEVSYFIIFNSLFNDINK